MNEWMDGYDCVMPACQNTMVNEDEVIVYSCNVSRIQCGSFAVSYILLDMDVDVGLIMILVV